MLPGGERDGEPLAVSSIGLEGPISPFPYVCDNRTVIGVMDRRRSEANLPEPRDPIPPGHDVIWLGVYPPPATLLAPSPASPSLLEAALPKIEFAGRINQVDFVQQVGECRLPFITGPTSMSYIYEEFEHHKQLWMGIWQHIHTVTTTEVSPDLGKFPEILDDVSVEMIPVRYH